ncbi:MAG TPA: DNA methyltransferase [Rhabdochlamydiaceae bacterium]
MSENNKPQLRIEYVALSSLRHPEKNPRVWTKEATQQLKESIKRFDILDPLIVNDAPGREGVIVGGNFRAVVLKEMGVESVPIVRVTIAPEKEAEAIIRLNKNVGEFDWDALAEFGESLLADIGFDSEELDKIFESDPVEQQWSLEAELEKLNIDTITVQKGDVYDLDGSRLGCGDSTIESDVLTLMSGEKADMVMTDPPYRLQYLKGKTRHGEATVGFGAKKNRRYLETESLPDDFTELWMSNVAKIQTKDFAIICYESWKNIREIWNEMEKHWKVKNMIVWHLPNRNQGYAGKYKLFSKFDIAMVGTSEDHPDLNLEDEDELVENQFQTALFAISGKPHWESYGKGKKYCPTDFIEFNAADEKSSGQAIVFGVKPTEILIPYIKILTTRGQLVYEPFGGSGSTLLSSVMLGRRCFTMEKSPVYSEIILRRWEQYSGKKRRKIHG